MRQSLAGLRRSLAEIEGNADPAGRIMFGVPGLDTALGGGLAAGALHEVFAAGEGDSAAASAFALALTLRKASPHRRVIWIRQDMAAREYGEIAPAGLCEFGAQPADLVIVQVRDALAALRAAADALRCNALGAVVVEPYGTPAALDLTASRRLNLAARRTGVTALVLRLGRQEARPSAAVSRWRVAGAASHRLAADAPGHPRFRIALLRHRGGCPPRQWLMEWDRDQNVFRSSPLLRPLSAQPFDRPAQAPAATEWRRAG